MICPHCKSDRAVKRNGKRKTKQRYFCGECDRAFVENPTPPNKRGRPAIGDKPLTPAEKMKRYREKKRKENK
jgi:transposase-like protein